MAALPRVVVTRPEPEAGAWAAQLAARGVAATALPLIRIDAPMDAAPLVRAWAALPSKAAVMFVSAAAVRSFFAGARTGPAWPSGAGAPRAWATGAGTAQALMALGVPAALIDHPRADAPQFDSEALWEVVAATVVPGQQVLIVRGAGADGRPAGRDWLAARLAQAGAQVEAVAAYRRMPPTWSAHQHAAARAAISNQAVWLFSSSEAVANLQLLLPGQGWAAERALATHERIAQAARAAGFGRVQAVRPTLDALMTALESTG